MINKATAGAEIEQQTYISKSETYKGEETMDAYKAEVSLGFKAIAKVTIGYESEKKTSETHTTSSVTTNSILRTRGGPDISRISGQKKNESMLYVENLVGLKQSGKYIFELIPAMKFANFSDKVKYTVQKLIQNATEDYYSFNYRPGCMDIESENFNKIANVDDGSCMDPKVLFAFSGVFQTCDSVSSKTETGENYYSSDRCEDFEKPNPMTSNFSCANGVQKQKVYSLTKFYNDRKAKIQKEKCGFFSFAFGCKNETVEVSVIDEIRLDVFWCPLNETMKEENETKEGPNRLDKICSHKTLSKLNNDPEMLKFYFNDFKDPMEEVVKDVCSLDPSKIYEDAHVADGIEKVAIVYDSMARAFSSADKKSLVSPREYSFTNNSYVEDFLTIKRPSSQTVTYYISSKKRNLLVIRKDQFHMIKYYPNVLKKLLPFLQIPQHLHYMRNLSDALVNSPKLLEQLIYNDTKYIYKAEPDQITHFGGAFKTGALNPFTGTYDCPPYFKPITILTDFNLCLSTDISTKYPLRLGGFYNCDSDLKLCPLGYSTYLGTILNGCEHYYCIRFHSRDDFSPPIINRPPYTDYKMANAETIPTD